MEREALSERTSSRSGRLVFGACGAYLVLFLLWTQFRWGLDPTIVSDVAVLPFSAGAALVAVWVARRTSGGVRRAWWWFTAAFAAWFLGDVAWAFLEVVQGASPFPSVADAGYLAFYPLAFVALVTIPVERVRVRDRLLLLFDVATVLIAAGVLLWHFVVHPTVADHSSSTLSQTLSLAYPAGDAVLLVGIGRVLFAKRDGGSSRAMRALIVALGAIATADVVFAHLDLTDQYRPGSLPDALWATGLALVAVAGYYEAQGSDTLAVIRERRTRVPAGTAPLVAMFFGVALLMIEAVRTDASIIPLGLGALAVNGLVVARQLTLQGENRRLHARLEHAALTDPLTLVGNRRQLFARGPELLTACRASGAGCAALMVDVDHFKEVNDQYGHAAGDRAVEAVARRCEETLRPGDVLARVGGDEFALLLAGLDRWSAAAFAAQLATRIQARAIDTPVGPLHVTATIGIAMARDDSTLGSLLHDADLALIEEKARRRERTSDFTDRPRRSVTPIRPRWG